MGLKFEFIDAKVARLCGMKYDDESQARTIQLCHQGAFDAAVVSVKFEKNRCNLQGMNWMVSLRYIAQATEEEQAKGTSLFFQSDLPRKCCRVGQLKPTRFYVLWVMGEMHDQVARDAHCQ